MGLKNWKEESREVQKIKVKYFTCHL